MSEGAEERERPHDLLVARVTGHSRTLEKKERRKKNTTTNKFVQVFIDTFISIFSLTDSLVILIFLIFGFGEHLTFSVKNYFDPLLYSNIVFVCIFNCDFRFFRFTEKTCGFVSSVSAVASSSRGTPRVLASHKSASHIDRISLKFNS